MRFSCEKTVLHDAISICIHAVSTKSSTQILEGLLIIARNDVTITGYNYKLGIQKSFDASVFEQGSVVINARILSDIIRKMPDDIVEISTDDKMTVTIKCASSEFNIVGSPSSDFPDMPEVNSKMGITLKCPLLKEMISATVFAVSINENKPIHTGSLFEVNQTNLGIISVDGYRLAIRRENIENLSENSFHFVVPGETLKEISRILPEGDNECSVYPERKHALFRFDDTVVTTRLLEGEFLNYAAAIPTDQPVQLAIDKGELITAIERVSLIISERLKNPVRCLFDGTSLKLSCITAMGRSFDECHIPQCDEKIEIGFNNRYLLDALRACTDEQVVLELKSGLSPCTIRPLEGDKYLYLVLPVRLKAGE